MQTGLTVIIHPAPIVQYGLKGILLSAGVGILDILAAFPGPETVAGWQKVLVIADTGFISVISPLARSMKRNGNTLAGVAMDEAGSEPSAIFDSMFRVSSPIGKVREIISGYLAGISHSGAENQLSGRETEVLAMVAQGFGNRQIGDRLFISTHTVISHRKNITAKLGIKSISGLTLYAAMNNLVEFRG